MIKKEVLAFIFLFSVFLVSFVSAQDDNDERNVLQKIIDWITERVRLGPKRGDIDTNAQYRVFVTSANFSGNELYQGDAFCQQLALQAGLTGKYAAWLSNSTKHAKDKINNGKYIRVDGASVANSKSDLLDGSLSNPINVNEYGIQLPYSICDAHFCDLVYTGTKADGTRSNNEMCGDWKLSSGNGRVGYFHEVNGEWTFDSNALCSIKKNIYCFEFSPPAVANQTNQTITCSSNLQCPPPIVNNFCNTNGMACSNNTYYLCQNSGTPQSYCQMTYGGEVCNFCQYGCSSGQCNPMNQTNSTNQTHLACVNQACVLIQGSGQNQCITNFQCQTTNNTAIEVCTPQDLNNVRNNLNGNYLQVCDIDLAGYSFEPIGNITNPFRGTYDSITLYKISNWTYNNPTRDYVGLFSALIGATIGHVTLDNFSIRGHQLVGSLAGYSANSTIYKSGVRNSFVNGTTYVGGLVGINQNNMGVGGYTGGIANSYVYNTKVYGIEIIGGLVGMNAGAFGGNILGYIKSSFASAEVNAEEHVGGFAGTNGGVILNSFSHGLVKGKFVNIGGFVGRNDGYNSSSYNGGLINKSYSSNVVIRIPSSYNYSDMGGFVGNDTSERIHSSYWDTKISGQQTSDGGIGLTTEDMKRQANFNGWDFVSTWSIIERKTYPWTGAGNVDLGIWIDYPFDIVNVNSLTPDESQYARHGDARGIEIINSVRGNVARFSTGDFVTPYNGNWDLIEWNNGFGVDLWVKIDKYTNETGQAVQTILSDGATGYYPNVMLFVNPQNKVALKFHYANNNTAQITALSTTSLQKAQWYHIEGEFNDVSKKLSLKINGVTEREVNTQGKRPYGNLAPLYIGSNNAGTQWYFNGAIDDLMITSD